MTVLLGNDTSEVLNLIGKTPNNGGNSNAAYGQGGNDTIYGSSYRDLLTGDAGDDILFGYDNSDTLVGGMGNDTMHGGNGDDYVMGGAGSDHLYGGGPETIQCTEGSKTTYITMAPMKVLIPSMIQKMKLDLIIMAVGFLI